MQFLNSGSGEHSIAGVSAGHTKDLGERHLALEEPDYDSVGISEERAGADTGNRGWREYGLCAELFGFVECRL